MFRQFLLNKNKIATVLNSNLASPIWKSKHSLGVANKPYMLACLLMRARDLLFMRCPQSTTHVAWLQVLTHTVLLPYATIAFHFYRLSIACMYESKLNDRVKCSATSHTIVVSYLFINFFYYTFFLLLFTNTFI
jgi:hypothetical protein